MMKLDFLIVIQVFFKSRKKEKAHLKKSQNQKPPSKNKSLKNTLKSILNHSHHLPCNQKYIRLQRHCRSLLNSSNLCYTEIIQKPSSSRDHRGTKKRTVDRLSFFPCLFFIPVFQPYGKYGNQTGGEQGHPKHRNKKTESFHGNHLPSWKVIPF